MARHDVGSFINLAVAERARFGDDGGSVGPAPGAGSQQFLQRGLQRIRACRVVPAVKNLMAASIAQYVQPIERTVGIGRR